MSGLYSQVLNYSSLDVNSLIGKLDELIPKITQLTGGHFEWVDSLLVQAITEGHWMLLSHANFCRYMHFVYMHFYMHIIMYLMNSYEVLLYNQFCLNKLHVLYLQGL